MPKLTYYRDLNALSGSSEKLRLALGGYYELYSASFGEGVTFNKMDLSLTHMGDHPPGEDGLPVDLAPYSPFLRAIQQRGDPDSPFNMRESLSADQYSQVAVPPAIRFPIRLVGDSSAIQNDSHWLTYLSGGSYGGTDYEGIINTNTYDAYDICFDGPHTMEEVNVLNKAGTWSGIYQQTSIQPRLSKYYSEYYKYISDTTSVRLIPNSYMLQAAAQLNGEAYGLYPEGSPYEGERRYATAEESEAFKHAVFPTELWEVVERQGAISGDIMKDLYSKVETSLAPDEDEDGIPDNFPYDPEEEFFDYEYDKFTTLYTDQAPGLRTYLTESIILHPLSASVADYADSRFKNIFFGGNTLEVYNSLPTMDTAASTTPLGVEIKIQNMPTYKRSSHASPVDVGLEPMTSLAGPGILNLNSHMSYASTLILKKIKEAFTGQIEESEVAVRTVPILCTEHYQTASLNDLNVREVETSAIKEIKMLDYVKLLTYAYQNYSTPVEDCFFMSSGLGLESQMARDENGTTRYSNTLAVYSLLKTLASFMTEYCNVTSLEQIYNMGNVEAADEVSGFGSTIVAYRIEKIGGNPTGDTATQNTLQNIWISRSPFDEDFGVLSDDHVTKYLDTQIKYGESYTYKVYAYMLAIGAKYKMSDLAVSRQVGNYEVDLPDFISAEDDLEMNCLEFFDPNTGRPTPQLYDDESNLDSSNDFVTNAQISSQSKYLADFYLNYEPTAQIIEIPVLSKEIEITDNPPTNLTVYPFQELNDKDTIGFYLDYETKTVEPYPTSLTDEEERVKTQYLRGYDLPAGSDIEIESVSKAITIQVYRLDYRPRSYRDFEGALYKSIDLRKTGTKYTYPDAYFHDKIATNTKYYYTFRVMNALGVNGPLTEIYEVQLVDDGGYKYSLFDTVFEESLVEETYVEPSKVLKKIFQLQPNLSHMIFNTDDVDFSGTAKRGIDDIIVGTAATESIWDKTFKIRLTSKKTGKKIDVNVTYNIKAE